MIRSAAWPADAAAVDVATLTATARTAAGRPATALTDTAGRPGSAPADRLAVARAVAATTPPLTAGTAARSFVTLAAIAAVDVALARTVEPHLDALSILAQADAEVPAGSTWGVFAAEGPGLRLEASGDGVGGVVLDGTKPWCSLASELSHALVTAHRGDDRQLFAVDLRQDRVTTHDDAWVARGMPDVPSGPVDFDGVVAVPVGDPGWYLTRPGFAWGGIGVAACWWGGAVGLARVLRDHAAARPDAELLRVALGAVVADLADAEDALADAAARIDADEDVDWPLVAQTVRSRVRRAVDAVRTRVVSTIGPGPLTSDPAVAARVADLELYVLQDHGDRDLARIGRMVLQNGGVAW
ncbi:MULTISPECIES: acyl-CoA dehydrogenase [unclassified Curtobacterium]|uniref:acyl-CoA dehydrogenase n=1 Tax=unclassified Curtobacterium TaxID=257496 RepID=UPI00226B9151|nr:MULTISPECIES: acyl-CoA dehydrogenase [unclassified Curtobacterium]